MKDESNVQEEIHSEFQVERLILFSDAVFAIVITLMALDIKLPEHQEALSYEAYAKELLELIPRLLAYSISFIFIGFTWYQHLKIFAGVRRFNGGLVFRNLLLLFLISFFPFGVSQSTHPNNANLLPQLVYFVIIALSRLAQLNLQHYILFKHPELRVADSIREEIFSYRRSRLAMGLMLIIFVLVALTYVLLPTPELKNFAWWWFMPFPILLRILQKRIKR